MHRRDKYTSRHIALKWKNLIIKAENIILKQPWTEQDKAATSLTNIPP